MRVRLNDSNSGSNDTPCGESNWGEVEDYNVFIVNLPVADFNITQTDNQVHFTNNSSNASIYQWNFGDGNTSNLPNPTHSYSSNGNYTVELTVSNDCGSTSANHTVNITSLGLSQVVNGIGIYPIPASEKMNIKYTSNDYSYKIISIDGREVISGKSNNSVQIIDISDLTPGIYQVQIQTSNEILSRSVVIE
jgi:PKD repeat protein